MDFKGKWIPSETVREGRSHCREAATKLRRAARSCFFTRAGGFGGPSSDRVRKSKTAEGPAAPRRVVGGEGRL